MLPAPHRLKGDKNFKRLILRGRAFFSPNFTIRLIHNGTEASRCAFVVSTKVSKKATIRNLLKRRMREIIRHELAHIRPGYDILIAAKTPALSRQYQELRVLLTELLIKAKIFNKTAQ